MKWLRSCSEVLPVVIQRLTSAVDEGPVQSFLLSRLTRTFWNWLESGRKTPIRALEIKLRWIKILTEPIDRFVMHFGIRITKRVEY